MLNFTRFLKIWLFISYSPFKRHVNTLLAKTMITQCAVRDNDTKSALDMLSYGRHILVMAH